MIFFIETDERRSGCTERIKSISDIINAKMRKQFKRSRFGRHRRDRRGRPRGRPKVVIIVIQRFFHIFLNVFAHMAFNDAYKKFFRISEYSH